MLRRLGDGLIIGLIAVTLLLLLEGVLRLVSGGGITPAERMPHPVYLVQAVPGTEHVFQRTEENGGQSITYRVNTSGFRGPEVQVEKTTPRIMIYGDSNVQARFSEFSATYGEQLRKLIARRLEKDVQVLNAGVAGFGPDQTALRLEEEIDRWKPDLVIVHIFADNDFGDLFRNKLFRQNEAGEIVPNRDVEIPHQGRLLWLRELQLYRVLHRVKRALEGDGPGPTDARGVATSHLQRAISKNESDFESYLESSVISSGDAYDADLALFPRQPSSRTKKALMAHVLRLIDGTVSQREGIQLLFLVQPSIVDVSGDNYYFDYEDLAAASPHYDRRRLSRIPTELLREQGSHVLNLYEYFVRDRHNELYFRGGDNHWNDAGQALAAELTAEYLERHLMLAGLNHP